MIINLSTEIHDIQETADAFNLDFNKETIIDFSGIIQLKGTNFISIFQFPFFTENKESITRKYIQEVSNLSTCTINRKSIRSYEFAGMPIFWCTNIALKHALYSVSKAVFTLAETINNIVKEMKFDEAVYLSFPSKVASHYCNLIIKILAGAGIENVQYIKGQTVWDTKNYLKNFSALHKNFYKHKLQQFSFSKSDSYYKNYFISKTGTEKFSENHADFFLQAAYKLSKENISTAYWPIIENQATMQQSLKYLPNGYLASMPTNLQFLKMFLKSSFYLKKFTVESIELESENLFLDKELIESELKNSVYSHYFLYYYGCWIKNYFSKIKETNVQVFYQDEFYYIGRIISNSLAKTQCKAIAVQHGLFDVQHSVYGIGHAESNKNIENNIPLPNSFIVWGNWFKKYFLSNNQLPDSFVKVLGNPKYFNVQQKKRESSASGKIKVLWCTDTLEWTQNDLLQIEEQILKSDLYEVTLRRHPLYDFMDAFKNELKLFERFPAIKISNNKDIFDDINKHDFLIVNCYTTAFLDAYIAGVPCIRLFPSKNGFSYFEDFKDELIYNVYAREELKDAIEDIQSRSINNKNASKENELLINNKAGWIELLKHQSN